MAVAKERLLRLTSSFSAPLVECEKYKGNRIKYETFKHLIFSESSLKAYAAASRDNKFDAKHMFISSAKERAW
jgi:hypothetical protein